jgi:hypothetical protein
LLKKKSNALEIAKEKIFQSLFLFDSLAHDYHFKLLVVFNPLYFEVIRNKEDLSDVIERTKTVKSIESLDLLEYYKNIAGIDSSNITEYYWNQDGHHNARGYRVYASGVEWKLKETGIIDSLKKE